MTLLDFSERKLLRGGGFLLLVLWHSRKLDGPGLQEEKETVRTSETAQVLDLWKEPHCP